MVISGEALLRAIYDRIVVLVSQRHRIAYQDVHGDRITIEASDIGEHPYELIDRLTFNDAIWVLKRGRVYPKSLVERMFVVKELRNQAIHRQLPPLGDYDPDDGRDRQDFVKLLKGDLALPEGYQFMPFEGRKEWIRFACRDHGVGTLKGLSYVDRYAAIQFAFTIETIAGMLSFPPRVSNYSA